MRITTSPWAAQAGLIFFLATCSLLIFPVHGSAAVLTVTTTTDVADGTCDAHCSLRDAVVRANADDVADEILVGPGTFSLSVGGAEADLEVTRPVHIRGTGTRSSTIISGLSSTRQFELNSSNNCANPCAMQLSNLVLTEGSADFGSTVLLNSGSGVDLSLTDVDIRDSNANINGVIFANGADSVRITGSSVESSSSPSSVISLIGTDTFTIARSFLGYNTGGRVLGVSASFGELESTTMAYNSMSGPTISFMDNSIVGVWHATIADNESEGLLTGGIAVSNGASMLLGNSVVEGNLKNAGALSSDCHVAAGSAVASSGSNVLSEAGSCQASLGPSIIGVSASLQALGLYGGKTKSFMPGSVSIALDAGGSAACLDGEMPDQRSAIRLSDSNGDGTSGCDLGAVERGAYAHRLVTVPSATATIASPSELNISIRSTGPDTLFGASTVVTVPSGVSIVSAQLDDATCQTVGLTATCTDNLGHAFSSGAPRSLRISIVGSTAGTFPIEARFSSHHTNTVSTDDSSSGDFTVTQPEAGSSAGGPGGSDAGNESNSGGSAVDTDTGQTDTVVVNPNPRRCTIVGTAGNDVLRGTRGRDVICGLGGNDTIHGAGGNDIVYGDAGNDTISGGAGNDRVVGGDGSDRLRGGLGNDTLQGGRGSDQLFGEAGNDQLFARDGHKDRVDGGTGRDRGQLDKRGVDRASAVERRQHSTK